MKNDKFIDVDYIDIQKEVFLTAPDVARETSIDEKRIRYWGDTFGDIKGCGVHKIDGRKKYTKQTIKAFKLIQKLIDEKQFSHIQVRDYISKNGFEYTSNSNDISKDLIGFNGLSSELSVEVEQKLNMFFETFKNYILENNKLLKDDIKEQVSLTVDEVISDELDIFKIDIQKELELQREENKKLSDQLDQVQQELSITKDINNKLEQQKEENKKISQQMNDNFKDMSNKIVEENSKMINEMKYVSLEEIKRYEQQSQQGFLSRLFHKKK